jgi:hypothetical protein
LIICDTSGIVAAYSATDKRHDQVTKALRAEPGPLVLSPFVLAEVDYLVSSRAGVQGELKVLSDVAAGVYRLAAFDGDDVARAAEVVQRYRDMDIGLADASIVVLAARFRTDRLLTLDERHFRAIRPLHADAFALLPADADSEGSP